MRRVGITGATGLVGANLAIELLSRGDRVIATRRPTSRTDALAEHAIEWVSAELSDVDALTRAFHGCEWVFHCAALVKISSVVTPELIATNVDGTRNVLEACRRARVERLVHCSSTAACAVSIDGRPVTEDDPWNLERVGLAEGYSITKREAQDIVLAAAKRDLDAVVVNPSYMFGPYDTKPSSGKLIVDVVLGRVPGATLGQNDFVDVRDVCRGMILAAERGRRGEKYILSHQTLTYEEVAALIARCAGVDAPRWRLPYGVAALAALAGDAYERWSGREATLSSSSLRYAFARGLVFSHRKATEELGYEPQALSRAINDAIAWFRANGTLPTE